MENLQKIKPKTLPDDKYAYMNGRWCALDFITSCVFADNALDKSMPSSIISIKELYQGDLDKAVSVSERPIKKFLDSVGELEYNIIPFNLYDATVFNSVASAGEDIFWNCNVELNSDSIKVKSAGLNYYIEHSMPKVLPFLVSETSATKISFSLDYHACYFIYQMLKNVTKTKPKNLLLNYNNDTGYLVLTDEDRSFYIIVFGKSSKLTYKNETMATIIKFFSSLTLKEKGKIDRKESGFFKDSLFKHLTKCLNDTLDQFESENVELYKNDVTKVFIMKKRL